MYFAKLTREDGVSLWVNMEQVVDMCVWQGMTVLSYAGTENGLSKVKEAPEEIIQMCV